MAAVIAELDREALTGAEAFRRLLVEPCRPAVIRGLCADWPVVRAAARADGALADYLDRFATDRPGEIFVGAPDIAGRYFYDDGLEGFNFERREVPLREGLRQILTRAETSGDGTVYMGSLPTSSYVPGFEADNALPFMPQGVVPRIWLGNASHVSCHYDTFENLACVVAGRRCFTLYPPDAIGDLYVGPIDRTLSGPPVSLAASAPEGDPRYPRMAQARARAVTVELLPGDALYLPKLWWHQVEATAPFNMLVNYWWDAFSAGPDAPMTAMMLAMIAIAERPAAEREAWRAYFDHYVFQRDGHPLAHLPEAQRGLLGPLRQGNYARIRALVMQQLRGG
ncbi:MULTISPECIES: cupin-like domain-containing protein [unclassified Sphingobium]|uniref:cupin-like domain-containing protein n=1 Tax=unclassified Sphingobium TaxID=2611147 RepID=UPI0022256045|nr:MULTISPECIES: cupin-like domain-containing protein [unclassified Sphingobium]MCW2381309.1 hypothetical protein [Sphingobium sp. B2D3B]MCW2398584.1 hypothetical protein [Sphingobium sp. B2D3C]